DDAEMFDTDDLHGDEVIVDMAVGEKQEKSAKIDEREVSTGVEDSATPTIPVTTADEGVTTAKIDEIIPTYAPTTVIDELTLAQTLIEIKATKPKAVTTDVTTTTTRPKARGVVVQEPSEFRTTTSSSQASQSSKTKDKGKAIMIKPEVPLKRKDQVALDEEMARNLEAQLQAELIKEVEDTRFPVISVYKGFDLLVDKNCCAYQTNRDQFDVTRYSTQNIRHQFSVFYIAQVVITSLLNLFVPETLKVFSNTEAACHGEVILKLNENAGLVDTSLIHIESCKPPTTELFDVDSGRIFIVTMNTKEYHSYVLAVITRIIHRTLDNSL
ncbi:hypothetical protein Tco_0596944, partial [Tanacetum coccineum]